MNEGIGDRIKTLRKEKNLTLADMAKQTELSLGFLSNLEHDQTSPTISNLHRICNALNITLNDILTTTTTEGVQDSISIVRSDERKTLFEQDNGALRYESMTTGNTQIKVTSMAISNDQLFTFTPHEHDELGIVVQGILKLQLEQKCYFLHAGDTIYIRSHTMHSGQRASDETCISYWVKLSPSISVES